MIKHTRDQKSDVSDSKGLGQAKTVLLIASMACLLGLSLGACSGLDTGEDDLLTPAEFFSTEQEILSFIAPAYIQLNWGQQNTSLIALQEVSSDEICVPVRGSEWYDGGHWQRLHKHQWDFSDPAINNTWRHLYSGVNECNKMIHVLEQQNGSLIPDFIAELRALRALYNYWLLDAYGNVPILASYTQDNTNLTNTPRAEFFTLIENELLEVIPLLPEPRDPTTYGRMHQYAAVALLVRLYLNAEVYTESPRWQDVIDLCDEVINSGLYRLAGDYFDNFSTNNQFSPEFIFAIPHDRVVYTGFQLHMMTLHHENQRTYNLASQPWNGWCAVEEFFDSYPSGDTRKGSGKFPGNFIYGPQYDAAGDSLFDPGVEVFDPDGPHINLTPSIISLDSALRQDGARIGKFEVAKGSGDALENDFPVMRYTDIILSKAEALWRLGKDQEGLALVNQIRDRAGISPLTTLNADNLLAERGREFFAEMHRRTDLIRFGKFGDPWWEKEFSEPCFEIFPLPREQLCCGNNLVQNECY